MNEIEQRLDELEALGLRRSLRMVSGPQGPRVLLDGRPVLVLCSNNYLGLADNPRVREAAADAAMRWGVGAGASRLVSGTMTIHHRLEEHLAVFQRSPACVLFGSGYLANAGVIGALAGRGDTVFSDELNHASIIDGCRLSRAEVAVYKHRDMDHLEWLLRHHGRPARGRSNGRSAERPGAGRSGGGRVIVTDSVFSMDADVAPLEQIVELADIYGARTIVDEAHALGVLGPGGRGAIAGAGLEGQVDVLIGTLGKALGSYGAYALATEATIDYLINAARPLIFSTAPPPPAVAGALAALEILEERPHRVQRVRSNSRALRRALAAEGFALDASICTSCRCSSATSAQPWTCARARCAAACSPRRSVRRRSLRAPRGCASRRWPRTPSMSSSARHACSAPPRARSGSISRRAARAGASSPANPAERRSTTSGRVRGAARTERAIRSRARGARGATGGVAPFAASVRGLFVTGTDTGVGKTV